MKNSAIYRNPFERDEKRENIVVISILVIAAILGLLAAIIHNPFIVIGLATIPIALLGLFWTANTPQAIPVLLVIFATIVPIRIPTGTETPITDGMVLTAVFLLMWLFRMARTKNWATFFWNTPTKWLLAFITIPVVSLVWSNLLRDPLVPVNPNFFIVQSATTAVMILLPVSLILVANNITSEKNLKIMFGFMLFAGALGIPAELSKIPFHIATGGMFTLWVIALSFGLFLILRKKSLIFSLFLLGLFAGWIYYRFFINITWVSGWLPGFVAIASILLIRSKKNFFIFLVFAALLILGNLGYYQLHYNSKIDISGVTRASAWQDSINLWTQHPLFGTGPGGYVAYIRFYGSSNGLNNMTHNNYLDMLAELGIVGFVLFIGFFVSMTIYGYRICKRLRGRGDFLEAASISIFAGLIGCLVALAMGDWLIPFPYTQGLGSFDYEIYSWLFLGAFMAIDRITRANNQSVSNVEKELQA